MGVEPGELDPPDTGRETLRVRLLGGMDLRLGDLALAPLDSARAESLLAYLLLHRDTPQPRQRLAFLLWPDSTESQALTNLRQVLFNLRHALPEADLFIDVQRRTLQWRAQAPLWLDVAIFEQAVAEGRLDDAVDVYGGDLLEGSYDDWLLDERERLAQLHLDALERLAVRLHGDGRWAEAIRYAERLLRHDPLREETHRLLMRLYSGSGDGGRALRVFHVCAATLQRELGIEPSAATRAVYEGLLAVEPADDAARAPGSLPAGAPLVGRSVERAQLTALWRDASRGRAQLVLVSGESGIGKSRLVDELRSWCGHRGAVTVEARAYAAEGTMAYGLVAGWLRAPGVLARVDRLAPADLTELARLMPDLLGRMPELPRPEPLPESEQRQRLFGAMARAIVRAGMPMLLVADDVQWCDAQSLQFVHYLLRAESQAPLLVAATVRREEIDAHHPVSEMIGSLQAAERITEIGLERLSRAETAILGERIRGRSLTDAEADGLYDESEGNPMFVVEALRLADEPSVAGSSPKVRGVIAARLAQLSPAAAELAGVAATIGREFTADVLADASGAEDAALVNGLDELWRRGLVRAHGPDAYDFSHGKIREAAYRALSPAQARNHHLHVARALERGRAAADAVSAQIAAHYEMAGASAEAVAWHRRAAGAAQRLHANADAADSLERALALLDRLPSGRSRAELELELLTALPAALVPIGGFLSARMAAVHERALALAARLDVEPEPPLVRAIALAHLSRGDFDIAQQVGERLRARAERDGDDVLWVESAYVLGVAAFWRGRLEDARAQLAAAVDRHRPERGGTHLERYGQDPQIFCLMRLAHALWLLGRDDEAGHALEVAATVSQRSPHAHSRVHTLVWSALLALDRHDEQELRRHTQALALHRAAGWQVAFAVELFGGYLEVGDGRVERGMARVRRVVGHMRDVPAAPGGLGISTRVLVQACAAAADAQAGLAAAGEALDAGGGSAVWEAEIRRLRASFLAALGSTPVAVEAELTRALETARRQGARPFEARVRADLERLHARAL